MSDQTVLQAESGRELGSPASRRLRRDDRIPAVVYGQGMEPLSISIARSDLRVAVSGGGGMNTVLDLTIDGTVYPALIKEIQRHPVRRTVQHVDFIQINLSEEVTVDVPVRLEGEAKDVEANNGLVDPAMDTLEITTTPRNIPNEIVVDISEMTMDSVIRVADLQLPAGVTTVLDLETPVATVLVMREEAEEEEAAEAGEGEGESAEAADAGDAGGDGDGE